MQTAKAVKLQLVYYSKEIKVAMKSKMRMITTLMVILAVLMLVAIPVSFGKGEILLKDDFSKKDVDKSLWTPAPSWKIIDGALDIDGGDVAGVSVKNDFTNFEFSFDFNMVSPLWSAEPVVRLNDQNNLYLFQIVADARHQFWPSANVGGAWQIAKLPDDSGVNPALGEWYSMKIIAEGGNFKCYYSQRGKELKLAFTWDDNNFKSGSIGFRELAGEHCMYDNVLVTTIGYSAAVNPKDALSITWGNLKE
jgi:hypothetical protein